MPPRSASKQKPDPAQLKKLAGLQTEIEAGIRALLREHRQRLDAPTVEAARAEEARLKKLARYLQRFLILTPPLSPVHLLVLELMLKGWQAAVTDFERKVIALGQKGQPNLPKGFEELVESLETVLKTEQKLLKGFETWLGLFPLPPDALVDSFKALIEEFLKQLAGFRFILGRFFVVPSDAFTASLEDLLRGCQDLLLSFEVLLKIPNAPNLDLVIKFDQFLRDKLFDLLGNFADLLDGIREKRTLSGDLVESFETLVRRYIGLLGSLEGLLNDLQPGQVIPIPPGVDLLENFEHSLHGVDELLKRFHRFVSHRITITGQKDPELLTSEMDLLRRFADRISSFDALCRKLKADGKYIRSLEDLLRAYENLLTLLSTDLGKPKAVNPGEDLIDAYEELLRALLARLRKFYDFIDDQPAYWQMLSFEDLLKKADFLIIYLIDLVATYVTKQELPDFIESLENLLIRLWARIRDFKDLIKEYFPEDKDLIKSFSELVDGFDRLLKRVQALKEKLDKVPEDLKKRDAKLVELLQKLLAAKQELLSSLKSVSSEEATDLAVSLIDAGKTIYGLGGIVLSGPAATSMRKRFGGLVAAQRRLARGAGELLKRVKKPSNFLRDAHEDLDWVLERLKQIEAKPERPGSPRRRRRSGGSRGRRSGR